MANQLNRLLPIVIWTLGINNAVAQPSGSGERVEEELSAHGWAVVCDVPAPAAAKNCSKAELQRLGTLAYESARTLAGLGFKTAALSVYTRAELTSSGKIFDVVDPQGASQQSPEEYFVLTVVEQFPPQKAHVVALYRPKSGAMIVKSKAKGTVIIHELLHAVQWGFPALYKLTDVEWIFEGTAAAVEPLASDSTDARGEEYRYDVNGDGTIDEAEWRNWQDLLNGEEDLIEYQVAEFWLSFDGTLNYLPGLFSSLDAQLRDGGLIHDNESYALVDRALQQVGEGTLRDRYLALIADRDNPRSKYYPWHELVQLSCDRPRCSVLDEVNAGFDGMTATRILVPNVKFPNAKCNEPSLKLELGGDESKHVFFVDNVQYAPGRTVDVKKSFTLWVVNVDTEPTSTIPQPTATLISCSDIRLTFQAFGVEAQAESRHLRTGAYALEGEGVSYETYDLGRNSVLAPAGLPSSGHESRPEGTHTSIRMGGSGDKAETKEFSLPPLPHNEKELKVSDVTVPGNGSASASIRLRITEPRNELELSGVILLKKQNPQDGWTGSSSAKADLHIMFSAPYAMWVTVEGCAIFERDLFEAAPQFTEQGGVCRFRMAPSAISAGEYSAAVRIDLEASGPDTRKSFLIRIFEEVSNQR